ncbi:MAG: hypothetical protein KDH95_03720 [Calditrichaeota bacterium]|nr:hypothetical protein [Calditrichota bacterium]
MIIAFCHFFTAVSKYTPKMGNIAITCADNAFSSVAFGAMTPISRLEPPNATMPIYPTHKMIIHINLR